MKSEKWYKAVLGRTPWNKGLSSSGKIENLGNFAKKGSIPWNKGKTKITDPRLNYSRPMSASNKTWGHNLKQILKGVDSY